MNRVPISSLTYQMHVGKAQRLCKFEDLSVGRVQRSLRVDVDHYDLIKCTVHCSCNAVQHVEFM